MEMTYKTALGIALAILIMLRYNIGTTKKRSRYKGYDVKSGRVLIKQPPNMNILTPIPDSKTLHVFDEPITWENTNAATNMPNDPDPIHQENSSPREEPPNNTEPEMICVFKYWITVKEYMSAKVTPEKREPEIQSVPRVPPRRIGSLKAKLLRMGRKTPYNILPPLPKSSTVTSETSNEQGSSQVLMSSFPELLMPDNPNLYSYNPNHILKPERFGIARATSNTETSEVSTVSDIPSTSNTACKADPYKMIENKRSYSKKDLKKEARPEPLYTVTTNSGNPVIRRTQRNRKRTSTGIGSLSRLPKTPKQQPVASTSKKSNDVFDMDYTVNKKSKLTNTYGKARVTPLPKRMEFTGSLCDRLKLIDTTPTGEDPYLIGEAEMREQSPIPKLMLTKSIRGRRLNSDTTGENKYTSLRPIYKPEEPKLETATVTDTKKVLPAPTIVLPETTFVLPEIPIVATTARQTEQARTEIVDEPDMDIVKTEPAIDWRPTPVQTESVNVAEIGENTASLCSVLPGLNAVEFDEVFAFEYGVTYDMLNQFDFTAESHANQENSRSRVPRVPVSLVMVPEEGVETQKRGAKSRRGRKRAFSAAGMGGQPPKRPRKPRESKKKAATRGKKSPVPSMSTDRAYHTQVGDPDETWYVAMDPNLKPDSVESPSDSQMSATVEVPQWREKPYTSIYTLEGTENVDDRVFEKRHQKLEADERRQLRWHVRRLREQRHTDRLRQRQRDSLFGSPANASPVTYTVWPRPQQDAHFIEISDTLPVTGFGEPMPALPPSEFILPWVRTSKALKRAKRSKTLH